MNQENKISQEILEFLKTNPNSSMTRIIKGTGLDKLKGNNQKKAQFKVQIDYLKNKDLIDITEGRTVYYSLKGDAKLEKKKKKLPVGETIISEFSPKLWDKIVQTIHIEIANFFNPYIEKIDRLWENFKNVEYGRMDLNEFKINLKEIYDSLNRNNLYGGLIPIPRIKSEIKKRNYFISEKNIDNFLIELEINKIIDLIGASDPSRLNDKELGIENIKRGLLYFIKWR